MTPLANIWIRGFYFYRLGAREFSLLNGSSWSAVEAVGSVTLLSKNIFLIGGATFFGGTLGLRFLGLNSLSSSSATCSCSCSFDGIGSPGPDTFHLALSISPTVVGRVGSNYSLVSIYYFSCLRSDSKPFFFPGSSCMGRGWITSVLHFALIHRLISPYK